MIFFLTTLNKSKTFQTEDIKKESFLHSSDDNYSKDSGTMSQD